jgi:hypothetical protein
MMRKLASAAVCVACCFSFAGCSDSDRPNVAPVRGKVTYNSKPVAGATVEFLCPGAPRPASGTTDADGHYHLTTFEPEDGAILGTHVITVNKYNAEQEESPLQPVAPGKSINEAIAEDMRRSVDTIEKAKKAKPLLPPKYGNRSTSDLNREVVAGENVIDIELKD